MSLPKEPRQKMINMMYLVLTALLALNVSAEILNAFKTVNNSLVQSNGVVSDKNQIIYDAFAKEEKEAQTMERAKVWGPKADEVRKKRIVGIRRARTEVDGDMTCLQGTGVASFQTIVFKQSLFK